MTLSQRLTDFSNFVAEQIYALKILIGDLSGLTTVAKDNLVNSINEVNKKVITTVVHKEKVFENVTEVIFEHNVGSEIYFDKVVRTNGRRIFVHVETVDENTVKINFTQQESGKVQLLFIKEVV